jgi:hypothetical protein
MLQINVSLFLCRMLEVWASTAALMRSLNDTSGTSPGPTSVAMAKGSERIALRGLRYLIPYLELILYCLSPGDSS